MSAEVEEIARRARVALAEAGYPDPELVRTDVRDGREGVLISDRIPNELRYRALELASGHEWNEAETGVILDA